MTTVVNGLVLNDRISKKLSFLQEGYALALAYGLDDVIGFLLEDTNNGDCNPKEVLDTLNVLHNARTAFLALMPNKEEGGAQ